MSGAPDFNAIGKSFVEYFYKLFDTDRPKLADLFKDESCLSFEAQSVSGRDNIMKHLCVCVLIQHVCDEGMSALRCLCKQTGLKFKKIQHVPRTLDVQPSGSGLLVMVTGQLKVDDEVNPILFTEAFHLIPTSRDMRSFWVKNDVFRLNYA